MFNVKTNSSAGNLAHEPLNQVDLCFVIDTTGSMGAFIAAAQKQLLETMSAIGAEGGMNLQVGLVEYRDHPPQDSSFVTRVHPLTGDLKRMQKVINGLYAQGGGDAPEAVYDGVHDACVKSEWRPFSSRFALLVGDAPPHGAERRHQNEEAGSGRRHRHAHNDFWANGCPCGLDARAVAAAAENHRVTVHSLAMQNDAVTVESFAEISQGTGGGSVLATNADEVVSRMVEMLRKDFSDLQFDRQMLEVVQNLEHLDVNELAEKMSCPPLQAAASIARLGKRGFLKAQGRTEP